MSEKSRLRQPFDKQHGKRAQALFKSASYSPLPYSLILLSQTSVKKSLLLTCKILGVLLNTLAADEKYPVLNRYNLRIPIQIQFSEKEEYFSQFFAAV